MLRDLRRDPVWVSLVLAGMALRLLAVVGITPTVYVDSVEYRGVALLGGERRPWTVPLVHALVDDGSARVVFHAVLGACAWAALAVALSEALRTRAVRLAGTAAVMAMGASTAVTNWDTTITSETVAVSLTVVVFALWIRFATSPSVGRAVALVGACVPFAFTRNDHPVLVSGMAVVALALAARNRRRSSVVLAIGLVSISAWSVAAWRQNDEIERFNLALVIANRVIPEPERLEWFVGRGMPLPREAVEPGADAVLALADDAEWDDWAGSDGSGVYLEFLIHHPRHFLLGPWPDLFGRVGTSLEPTSVPTVMLSPADRYGRVHQVLPDPVEEVAFAPGNAGSVLVSLFGVAAVGVVRGRRWPGPEAVLAAAALCFAAGHLLLVWHASPNELGRLAMAPATTVHVATLSLVAFAAEHVVARRRGT